MRDLKEWISEREDVAAFLHNFTEARLIISSLEVWALHVKKRSYLQRITLEQPDFKRSEKNRFSPTTCSFNDFTELSLERESFKSASHRSIPGPNVHLPASALSTE